MIKNKLVRNLVIGVVAIAALLGVYFWVSTLEAKPEEGEPSPTPAATIELFSAKSDEVDHIIIDNPDMKYTLKREIETVETTDADGNTTTEEKSVWKILEYPNVEFSKVKLENAVYDLITINATREITDDMSRLGEFGLADSQKFLTIVKNDGTEKSFVLGDKAVGSSYYFMEKDGDQVYTIASYKAEAMMTPLDDYRDKALASVDMQQLTQLSVSENGTMVMNIRAKTEEEGTGTSMSSLMMDYPYLLSVDAEELTKITDEFTSIEVGEFVEDDPSDLAQYGLDVPACSLSLTAGETQLTIHFGAAKDQDTVYARMDGKNFVFTQPASKKAVLTGIDPFDYVEKFSHIINIDTVSSIVVEGDGQRYEMGISRTTQKNDEGEDETVATYTINGKKAEEDAFKGAYQQVIGIMVTGYASQPFGSEALYTVTFHMNDGSQNVTTYRPYDERSFGVDRGDGTQFTVLKKEVTSVMEKLAAFEADPTQRP